MIKVYTIPNCEYCDKVKDYLRSKNIEFEEINLKAKENREARAFYRSLGIDVAPVVTGEIDGIEWYVAGDDIEGIEKSMRIL